MSAQDGVSHLHTCTLRAGEGEREEKKEEKREENDPFLLATQRFFQRRTCHN
jgi:hypothetical protein